MAFDDFHVRTAKQQTQDRADAAAKRLMCDAYRELFPEAFKRCPCHCHLAEEGIRCTCLKNCEHCRPADR